MYLSASQVQLLRRISELPESERVTSGAAPSEYEELEQTGHVKITPLNVSDLLIEITEHGRRALETAEDAGAGHDE